MGPGGAQRRLLSLIDRGARDCWGCRGRLAADGLQTRCGAYLFAATPLGIFLGHFALSDGPSRGCC